MKSKNEKISESMEGNTNAVKWSEEDAKELFDLCDEIVDDEIEYSVKDELLTGYKYDFLGELIKELKKQYKGSGKKIYRKLLSDWLPDKYSVLKVRYIELKEALEANCYSNTKKGIINTAVGIVNLKSNHGWTDRVQNDHTSKGDKIESNFVVSSKEQQDKMKDFLDSLDNEE